MKRLLSFLLLLWLTLWLTGCSQNAARDARVREALDNADPASALAAFDEEECASVDCLLQRGHMAYLAGDYRWAQRNLAAAEWLIQEHWTLNLGLEAASLAVNDGVRDYGGEQFEKVWVNFVRALGYLAAGEPWEAAVEGRAITRKLTALSDQCDDLSGYHNDPFLQYFAGLLAEAEGEVNRAWINYRAAERLYSAGEVYGAEAPASLGADLIRAAEALSFNEDAEQLRNRYPGAQAPGPGEGELVILVSEGLIPQKYSDNIAFPFFEDDDDDEDGLDALHVATYSYDNWHAPGPVVDYFVNIALPAIAEGTRAPILDWSAGAWRGDLDIAADLGHLSRRNLQERYATVVIRTLARGLIKYWAAEKAEEKKGEIAGLLVNLLGVATEWADTRGWVSLPERIHMARVTLPVGRQQLRVGPASGEVEIRPGELGFLHLRLY